MKPLDADAILHAVESEFDGYAADLARAIAEGNSTNALDCDALFRTVALDHDVSLEYARRVYIAATTVYERNGNGGVA